jgi:fructose-bisphosphate aldolase class II
MSLVTLDHALSKIGKECYGIGAFNIANMEMVMGAIKAAEELKSPIILQVAEGRLKYSPLHLIAPVMIAAAKAATIPVVVHLDHGSSM